MITSPLGMRPTRAIALLYAYLPRLFFLAAIVLACFGILELLVRLAVQQVPRPLGIADPLGLTISDPELGSALKPNFEGPWVRGAIVRTNSMGLRDIEYTKKARNELRILSLGDSNAFGWGVEIERSYAKVLERLLASELQSCRISVVNGAVYGYSTYQQRVMFERLRERIEPDFVIATFSASNDVIEDATIRERIESKSGGAGGVLARHSHLVRLVLRVAAPALYFAGNRWPSNVDHTNQLMNAFINDLRARALPHELVIIPARHQIRPQGRTDSVLLARLGMEWLLTYHNHRVAQNFAATGVSYTDTLPPLAERDKIEHVAFTDHDNHMNELGHQIIAEAIHANIRDRIREIASRRCANDPLRADN